MTVVLPNVRRLFVPDPGYMLYEADLSGADAQVVAAEADDLDLRRAFKEGLDVHAKNASDILGESFKKLTPESPAWKSLRKEYKTAVHATNYGASPHSLCHSLGWTLHQSRNFQNLWFNLHPGVRRWQQEVQYKLSTSRKAENRFGYRIVYFDRVDGLLPQALAWIPQSTVALITYKGAIRMQRECPWAHLLLQVHDSLVFQVPFHRADDMRPVVRALEQPVPYPDPLLIPWGFKRSEKSWGDCKRYEVGN